MKQLQVATERALPVEILQDSTTIFGRKRSGKSNNAVVLVEEALDLHAQVVVIDPKGDWWGITSSFDGKSEGYPVVVLGGKHATLELNPYAGATVAEWILETGYSVVVDLSLLGDAERNRFCAAFLEVIRRRKVEKPGPILLVIDEADELAPEDQRERIHVIDAYRLVVWMVKRGGFAGVASILITQRPASLSKNVTTQSETVIVLHVSGSQDLDAVADALKHHVPGATKKERTAALDDLLREIVQLDKGATVLVSASRGLKGEIHRIQFRRRRTFDSGATPEFGKQLRAPKVVAKVAIEQLSAAMEKAVAEAKANDPAELKKALAAVRKELEAERRKQPAPAKPETRTITKYALRDGQLARIEKITARLEHVIVEARAAFAGEVGELRADVEIIEDALRQSKSAPSAVAAGNGRPAGSATTAVRAAARASEASGGGNAVAARAPRDGYRDTLTVRPDPGATRSEGISAGAQRTIDAIAYLESIGADVHDRRVAGLAGVSPKSSTWRGYKAELRRAALITSEGHPQLTDAGRAAARLEDVPTTSEEIQARAMEKLSAGARRVLQVLVSKAPEGVDRAELAERAGTVATSSTFRGYMAELNRYGVLESVDGRPAAAAWLFLEERVA